MPAIVGTVDPDAAVVVDDADDFAAVVVDDESLFLLLEQAVKSSPTLRAQAARVMRLFIASPSWFGILLRKEIRNKRKSAQNEQCRCGQCFCARVSEFGVGPNGEDEIGDESQCGKDANRSDG